MADRRGFLAGTFLFENSTSGVARGGAFGA